MHASSAVCQAHVFCSHSMLSYDSLITVVHNYQQQGLTRLLVYMWVGTEDCRLVVSKHKI